MLSSTTTTEHVNLKLATTSANTNSFGLRGCIWIARDGRVWETMLNAHNLQKYTEGAVYPFPVFDGVVSFRNHECPRLVNADLPTKLLRKHWPASA